MFWKLDGATATSDHDNPAAACGLTRGNQSRLPSMLGPFHRRSVALATAAIAGLVVLTATGLACNIPVFRFALERWRPDSSQLIIFHAGPLSPDQQSLLGKLDRHTSTDENRGINLEIRYCDLNTGIDPQLAEWWTSHQMDVRDQLPYAMVRIPHPRGWISAWHGSLAQAVRMPLFDSPCRVELSRRLLAGDAIVWVLVRSEDSSRNRSIRQLLEDQFPRLEREIELPDGIGLPGSELFSNVPLVLKFSLLEFDSTDPAEPFLSGLFTGIQPESLAAGEPLVVPVFGRGRALEVIPASQVTDRLIADVTEFLCGACSCQVKEQNPGFDLLLAADWERRLFGDASNRPPDSPAVVPQAGVPQLLTIPPGR